MEAGRDVDHKVDGGKRVILLSIVRFLQEAKKFYLKMFN